MRIVVPGRAVAHRFQTLHRGILGAVLTVGAFTLVARLTDTARELIVANQFGVSDAVDAFVIAFLVPKFVMTVVADSFSVALLPVYFRVRDQDGLAAADRLVRRATLTLLGLLVVLAGLLALVGPILLGWLASSFDPEKLQLTESMYRLLLPTFVVSGCSRIWSNVANASGRFAVAALAPSVVPLLGITFFLAEVDRLGIRALAIGTLIGFLVEALIQAANVRRTRPPSSAAAPVVAASLRPVLSQYGAVAAVGALMASTILVDQAVAASLGSGSVAELAFGSRVSMFLIGVGAVALSTTLFPRFSQMAAARQWGDLLRAQAVSTKLILTVTVPLTLALVLLSGPLVRLLFQHGAFQSGQADGVAVVQALYLLQLPFYLLSTVGVRMANALSLNRQLLPIVIGNIVVNLVGDLVLSRFIGVAGIALSTSLVYLFSCAAVFVVVRRNLRRRIEPGDTPGATKTALPDRPGSDAMGSRPLARIHHPR